MKRLSLILLVVSTLFSQRIQLNYATFEEIKSLPLTLDQAYELYDYVVFQGPVTSIYELSNIPGFDASIVQSIKPLIALETQDIKGGKSRLQDQYRKVENWTSTEGANEGLIEVWLDRLAEPININKATYDDLMSLQNVSPVDAVAVLNRQKEGSIDYPKALRGATNLSYWGYKNMSDFFTYGEEDLTKTPHFWYNMTYKTVPSNTSFDEEVGTTTPLSNHPGNLQHKALYTSGSFWKVGYAYHRQMGEQNRYMDGFDSLDIPKGKIALTLRNLSIGNITINRLIFGNFTATMGQGIVFESTDFFSPRRSGYGWSRRVVGVFPDLSRSHEYALQGIAAQASSGIFNGFGFVSLHSRDAIVNSDSTFSTLITLSPRTNVGFKVDSLPPVLDQVNELTFGGNLRIALSPGMIFGISSYESLYDRELSPQITQTVIAPENAGKFLTSIGNSADTEIAAMYASSAKSPIWKDALAMRRVFGMDFTTVINNLALQGEYGILDKDGIAGDFETDPRALVLSAYLQFNSLTFLVVYRDYDLEFDNPYQRSFSNYQRYKGTIFEDTFYLEDPIFGFLYNASAQPQSERGVYFESRYQFHRQFVLSTNFDTWTRVADNARYYRTVVKLQYRPVFNYRFNIRQKWQMRGAYNEMDPSTFFSRETIVRAQLRLSRYNSVELLYVNSSVDFTNRRRLTVDPTTGRAPALVGGAGTGSEALGFKVTHNITDRLKIMSQAMIYNGFIWNFEDTDFRVFDSSTDAFRFWVALFSKLGDHWALRVKWTTDTNLPITNYAFAPEDSEAYVRKNMNGLNGLVENSDVRIQVDYAF